MAKATIRVPKDQKHRIVIPNEIWEVENIREGDYIEVDIRKIKREAPAPLPREERMAYD